MRKVLTALGAAAFAFSSMTAIVGSASAAGAAPTKSSMGCIVGKEKWNAVDGKCIALAPVKKAVAKKPAAKPAAEKKA